MKVVEHEVTCRMKIFHLMEAPLESFPFFFWKITPLNSVKLSRFNFNQGVKKKEKKIVLVNIEAPWVFRARHGEIIISTHVARQLQYA